MKIGVDVYFLPRDVRLLTVQCLMENSPNKNIIVKSKDMQFKATENPGL